MAGRNFRIVQEEPRTVSTEPNQREAKVIVRDGVEGRGQSPQVDKLLRKDGEGMAIDPLRYTEHEKGLLYVRVGHRGDDYFYQIELKRPPSYTMEACIGMIIHQCDGTVPTTADVFIYPPPADLDWWSFELRVADIAARPGAKDVMEKKLVEKFLALNFWQK